MGRCGFAVLAGTTAFLTVAVIGADWPEDQFAQYGSGGAVEDDDMVGCGFNDRDALALPVHADADFALAVAAGFDADSGAALLGGGVGGCSRSRW